MTQSFTECSSSKETQTSAGLFERYLSRIFDNETKPYSGLTLCSLCSEPWVQDTDHRISLLKCGHLFGESCLNEYLKSSRGGQKCPECKISVRRPDIRTLFVKTVVAIDKSDEITMENAARTENTKFTLAGVERNNLATNIKLFQNQLQGLKIQRQELLVKIEKLRARRGIKPASTPDQPDPAISMCVPTEAKQGEIIDSVETPFVEASNFAFGNFVRVHDFELHAHGDCRLLTSSDRYSVLVCSQKSNSELFEGYGIRTLSIADFRPKMFIPLHRAQIKDIGFHPNDPIVLTASLDKTVKQTNIHHGTVMSICTVEDAAWSCCWNESHPERFFVGLKNGRSLEFDVRATHCPLNELKTSEKLPVASLSYVKNDIMKGVICTRLRGSEFYAHKTADLFERYPMPIMGNFTSAYYDNPSSNFLISSRPFKRSANISHSVSYFYKCNNQVSFNKLLFFRLIS